MIAIFDYGSGNIRSALRALERAGLDAKVTSDVRVALAARGLVIPGVGAFASCMKQLRAIGGEDLIKERIAAKKPILGICVGMQILFERSEEDDERASGIGIMAGKIHRLKAKVLPQIGWNTVAAPEESQLFKGISAQRFYFVHSYAAIDQPLGARVAVSEYGERFVAALEIDSISAVQFHPEKSGLAGIQLLKNWGNSL